MPEVKNTFLKSKMNKDLDARILPNGEYRDAENVNVSKSEGDDVGSLENVLSNIQVSDIKTDVVQAELNYANSDSTIVTKPTETQIEQSLYGLEIIGQFMDVKNNRIFIMLTNYTDTSANRLSNFANPDHYEEVSPGSINTDFVYKGAGCYIYMLDINGNTTSVLVGGNFLNFSKTHKILNINLLEDLLFWNDNRNQPRKINTSRAYNQPFSSGDPYYYNEDHISVAKFAPVLPISLIEEVASNTWESTMQSVTQEYLPIHLIDTLIGATGIGGAYLNTERNFTFGSSSSMLWSGNITTDGDKVTVEVEDDEYEFTVTSTGAGSVGITPTAPVILPEGSVVKFQRINPFYDTDYIGDENVLKDKFIRFSYRFKYDDNEYSLFAPFTQEVFIPKQFGYFIDNDEEKAGKSGIVSFMENLVDKVKFNIRLPYVGTNIENILKVKEIQIVSKASNEQAVKVIEDIPISDLTNTQDYIYEYNSIKPYKTLPENDLTRVHDKVPIRAKCQEITSNRVLYGNFVDKHTSPDFLDYQLKINRKNVLNVGPTPSDPTDVFSQVRREYPTHTLKQNRSYTVGVVLVDRYGRSSNVILSKQNVTVNSDKVSTIYSGYTNFGTDDVIDWPGNVLEIQFNNPISNSGPEGYPGLYSETNPLGWYSYKIVVKQQEQEYYNVYLPGILAGEITWATTPLGLNVDRDDYDVIAGETAINQPMYINSTNTSLISLFGDNINKIPRNLNDVGATDIDFGSSVELFNRVNPNNWDSEIVDASGALVSGLPYNTQSSVNNTSDTIDFIKPFKQLGKWTTTKGNAYPEQNNVLGVPPFADPWYPFTGGIDASGGSAEDIIFKDPLYKSNENPFIASISTQFKTGVNPKQSQSAGNYYYANTGENRLGDTTLGVYETNPVESLLELFWETSTAGLIENDGYTSGTNQYEALNVLIDNEAGNNGPFSLSELNFDLKESDPIGTFVTDIFEMIQSDGNPCNDTGNTMTILSVLDGNGNERKFDFELKQNPTSSPGSDTLWQIKSKKEFVFLSDANIREKYNFTLEGAANGQTNTFKFQGQLSNEPPVAQVNWPDVRYNGTYLSTIPVFKLSINAGVEEVLFVDVYDFYNGSIASSEVLKQLVFSCDFVDISSGVDFSNNFSINQLSNGQVYIRVDDISGYPQANVVQEFTLKVTDANGNGNTISINFDFNYAFN